MHIFLQTGKYTYAKLFVWQHINIEHEAEILKCKSVEKTHVTHKHKITLTFKVKDMILKLLFLLFMFVYMYCYIIGLFDIKKFNSAN